LEKHPGSKWFVGDLAELDLTPEGIAEGFDVVASVGNVMPFLAPSTRQAVLTRMREQLLPTGRIVVGFGAGRGYDFAEFSEDAEQVGLVVQLKMGTWDMNPLTDDSDFMIAILAAADSS